MTDHTPAERISDDEQTAARRDEVLHRRRPDRADLRRIAEQGAPDPASTFQLLLDQNDARARIIRRLGAETKHLGHVVGDWADRCERAWSDADALRTERDELAEKLAAATRTVATIAVHRHQLIKDLAACAQATAGEYWRTVADGYAATIPPDGPQPHAPGPQAPSGQPEPHTSSNGPQRGAGDVEPFGIRIGPDGPVITGSSSPAPLTDRQIILGEISQERDRQLAKWGEQHHDDGSGLLGSQSNATAARIHTERAAEKGEVTWQHILAEEVFEALAESDLVALRDELIQVAAVAVAWIEDIQSRPIPTQADDPL